MQNLEQPVDDPATVTAAAGVPVFDELCGLAWSCCRCLLLTA
jgi:hypothetical protein